MVVNFNLIFGMAIGLALFDNEDLEVAEAEWGFTLFLGPVMLTFYKPA